MAQFWIAIFFILLAGAQLYQSVRDIALPFPVYLVLGTVLAVAANSRYQFGSNSERVTLQATTEPEPALAATSETPAQIAAAADRVATATPPAQIATLPDLNVRELPISAPIQSDEPTPKKPSRPRKKSAPKQPKQQP